MTLSLQEISDRLELQDLVTSYADIIDRKAFDELRDIFTADASIDFTATGGPLGTLEETIQFLVDALVLFPNHQHLISNTQFRISGDQATGKVMCFNPMEMTVEDGTQTFMLGIWYIDTYERLQNAWRFKRRVQETSWSLNFPEHLRPNP